MNGTTAISDNLAVSPNAFQRLMLQWERLAPYNAAQYASLTTAPADDHVQACWRDVVISLGLQQIGQSPETVVDLVTMPIESFVTDALNRPFGPGDAPLRPFIQREGSRAKLGIFYRHVIADSASIRVIVRAWIERVLKLPAGVKPRHVGLLRDGALKPFDKRRSWNIVQESVADFSRLSRTKRVRRLFPTADPTSTVRWRRVELPRGSVGRLLDLARRRGVRVNDLFVASAAMSCDGLMPHEDFGVRRDLGIGTIADVRPHDRPADRHFGLMLGFLQTFWRWQDLGHWERTLAVAASQSRVARERCFAEASVIRLLVARRLGEGQSIEELATFYRKRCPLAAGISNINLNRGWPAALFPSPIEAYTRVSPLGPMLPLVFTPTTLGDTLHLGVTYRTSVLSDATADAIIDRFVGRLDQESR